MDGCYRDRCDARTCDCPPSADFRREPAPAETELEYVLAERGGRVLDGELEPPPPRRARD